MSAETLRRAASLMREKAEAATGGPWSSDGPWLHDYNEQVSLVTAEPARMAVAIAPPLAFVTADDDRRESTMEHIASWHPAVALAVADWLDFAAETARQWEAINHLDPETQWSRPTFLALQIARLYLGESS